MPPVRTHSDVATEWRALLSAVGLATVVVVMLASCGSTVLPPPASSPAGEPRSPVASSSIEPADPSASDGIISWEAVVDSQHLWSTPAFENLQGVVPFGGGFLVYGYGNTGGDSGSQEAVIWLTSDLQMWTAHSFDQVAATDQSTTITEIAGNDRGLVAVGNLCCPDERVVWHSVDGESWTGARLVGAGARPERIQLHGVAAGSPGFVVVGEDHGSAAAWFSVDGTTWTRAGDLAPGTIRDVAPLGSGFIAVGRVQDELDNQSRWDAAVWISDDGLSWSRVGESASALTSGDAELASVVPFDGGVLMMGHVGEHDDRLACRGDPCVWSQEAAWVGTSELDGWQGPLSDAPRLIDNQNVIASRGGLLANDGDVLGQMWTSSGGLQWERWPASQPFPRGAMTALATLTDSTIVAIGNVDGGDATGRDGAIWIGTIVKD